MNIKDWFCRSGLVALVAVAGLSSYGQEPADLEYPVPEYEFTTEEQEPHDLDSLLQRLQATEQRLQFLEEQGQKQETKKPEPPKEKKWYDNYSLRGYAQFRYNYTTHTEPGSATPNYAGDSSIGPDQEFLIRRARLIFTGNVSDHLRVYLQPDFASTPDGSASNILFAQIRDWYGDIFLDKEQVHRFRVGQSKVPYGWENLQSSQNRLYLDRNDAFNSATRNERDLGVFYYWTPEYATDLFKILVDEGLKGSGNYGIFGIGVYNGQGGSLRELNDDLHVVARLTCPIVLNNGDVYEVGIQGYTGQYVVRGSAVSPNGVGAAVTPTGTLGEGILDNRLGWTFVKYPQPFGIQAEWTVGRGPALNETQTAVTERSLYGGYVGGNYKFDTYRYGTISPYCRYQYFQGGYKSANNAPFSQIEELDFGLEWQIRKEVEFVTEYVVTDRTNLTALSTANTLSYGQFEGEVLRFQLQCNY